jgi:hypothetical protein
VGIGGQPANADPRTPRGARRRRARLDPLDPSTFHHAGQCEHRDTTDPSILRAIVRVHYRESYWWVECSACDSAWQVRTTPLRIASGDEPAAAPPAPETRHGIGHRPLRNRSVRPDGLFDRDQPSGGPPLCRHRVGESGDEPSRGVASDER